MKRQEERKEVENPLTKSSYSETEILGLRSGPHLLIKN
jgi:hypothetical protein